MMTSEQRDMDHVNDAECQLSTTATLRQPKSSSSHPALPYTLPASPSSSQGSEGVASSRPATPSMVTGLSRKRSFKRRAPPPPLSSSAAQSMGSIPSTVYGDCLPPAPVRSQSSYEATNKLQAQGSLNPTDGVSSPWRPGGSVGGVPNPLDVHLSEVSDQRAQPAAAVNTAHLYANLTNTPSTSPGSAGHNLIYSGVPSQYFAVHPQQSFGVPPQQYSGVAPQQYPGVAPQSYGISRQDFGLVPALSHQNFGVVPQQSFGISPQSPRLPLSPEDVLPPSSPSSWARGLNHSLSEGCVQRGQLVPSAYGPSLVPLVEETVAPDGTVVPRHYFQQQQDKDNTNTAVAVSGSEPCTEDLYSELYYGSPGHQHKRLSRSDSVITVAHLCEDLYVVSPFIRVTLTNLTGMVVVAALVVPNTAIMLYTLFRLVFGTLFPAYYSYKAVKTKNVKEYVKWMMYWIVFAFFTCLETITDLFMAFWFPFYYELKILLVLWLLSPATRGSSVLYRKFVHPWLTQREEDIDECIAKAKQQGYSTVLQLGTKGVNYATTVLVQTALKGGGGIVNQLKRSYSVGELAAGDEEEHMGGDHNRNNVKALHHQTQDTTDYQHSGTDSGAALPSTSTRTTSNKSSTVVTGPRTNTSNSPPYSVSPSALSEDQSSSDELGFDQRSLRSRVTTRNRAARARLF